MESARMLLSLSVRDRVHHGSSPNFLIKNKRSVRNASLGKCQKPLKAPPAKRPVQHQRIPPAAPDLNRIPPAAPDLNSNTVVLIKSYLDELRASVAGNSQEDKQPQLVTSTPKCLHKSSVVHQHSELSPLNTCAATTVPSSTTSRTTADDIIPGSYFPFGRPGCGAPLRSDSGKVVADLRTRVNAQARGFGEVTKHSRISPNASLNGQSAGEKVKQVIGETTSPRYARGAGPHVSEYMIREREGKRKKDLEHVEYLKAQIAAKEQAKRQWKEQAKQEERLEEARMKMERQRLRDEFERETEKARRKEEESRLRQAILQKAIDNAANQSKAAHYRSGVRDNARDHTTHHRKLPQESHKETRDRKTNGGQQVVTFKLAEENKTAASPSTLQLLPVPLHKLEKAEMRSSRIPVRSRARATNKAIMKTTMEDDQPRMKAIPGYPHLASRRLVHHTTDHTSPEHPHLASRRLVHHTTDHTSPARYMAEEGNPRRMASPPVPALAKKLKQQGLLHTQETPLLPTIQVEKNNPPVPAAAWQKNEATRVVHVETLPPIVTRLPACNDEGTPIIPAVGRKDEHLHSDTKRDAFSVYLSPLSSEANESQRHGVIFQQLSKLRKGLMSHRSSIDNKLASLL